MEVFKEAGVHDGVINLVYVSGPDAGDVIFNHADFAGLHFTGSTGVFQDLWATIGNNIAVQNYPRIVGETGGKDFILAHKSATPKGLTAITRGAFEFQGQKCSAASRVYVPNNIWDEVKGYIIDDANDIKNNHMGTPHDFKNSSQQLSMRDHLTNVQVTSKEQKNLRCVKSSLVVDMTNLKVTSLSQQSSLLKTLTMSHGRRNFWANRYNLRLRC